MLHWVIHCSQEVVYNTAAQRIGEFIWVKYYTAKERSVGERTILYQGPGDHGGSCSGDYKYYWLVYK